MDERGRCPQRVVVVGAGASGVLVTIGLAHSARGADRRLDLTVVDPRPRAGGVAYSTDDPRHLLNVPAGRMSAHPDRAEHFTEWLRAHVDPAATAAAYATRGSYRRYLVDTVDDAPAGARRQVTVDDRRTLAVGLGTVEGSLVVRLGDGGTVPADAVVLATGRPGLELGWVPASLLDDPRFVADPWAPGRLASLADGPGDVLLVGTGLTMVDVALSLVGRRVVHAVSRHGWLPRRHRPDPPQPLPLPALPRPVGLARLRAAVAEHVERSLRETGDWRPAVDGLRRRPPRSGGSCPRRTRRSSSPTTRPAGASTATAWRRRSRRSWTPRSPRAGCTCRAAGWSGWPSTATGEHEAGLAFLDPWTARSGRTSAHRAHFSWRTALHELRLGRIEAVRRRFDEHLAPPAVGGVRALVDSASLLMRCQLAGAWRGRLPTDEVLGTVDEDLLVRPGTPFIALHASVGLTAAGRVDDLVRLEQHAAMVGGSVFPDVVGPLCRGMRAHVEGRLHDCAAELYPLLPRLGSLGGSAAQREVVEDTLLHALTAIGWTDEAIRVLQVKLDRRRDRSARPKQRSTGT